MRSSCAGTLSGIPTTVDLRTFRLEVGGHVNKPLSLSLNDLQTKFEPVSLVALAQCAGNSRSLFEPQSSRRAVGQRRHGQCSLEGRATERRAGCGRRDARSGSGGAARTGRASAAEDAALRKVACRLTMRATAR